MNRTMWVLAAVFAVMAIVMIYQSEFGGGIDRPWAECKENLIQQMISNRCTPREGGFSVVPPPGSTD